MEPITINPADIWQIVLAVCGGVITLSGAGAVLASIIHKIRAPNKKQDERIAALEEKCGKIEERLVLGNKRFESDAEKMYALEQTMKATNKIIIESLQALTAHAIDGNNTEQLKKAEQTLNNYLIEKI
jgi:hypothetical protein